MSTAEELFHRIGTEIPDAKEGKMFGALCLKAPNGKAAVMFYKEDMIFKLQGEEEKEALALKGAKLFDPAGGRPMGGWVQLSAIHSKRWPEFAQKAMAYVRALKK